MAQPPNDTYVELKIAAVDLRGRRLDPFAVLCHVPHPGAKPVELARTETVWSEASPSFVQSFRLPCEDDQPYPPQDFRLQLYSRTSRNDELHKNTLLGFADFSLDRCFAKPDGVIERVLRNKAGKNDGKRGSVIICAELVSTLPITHTFSIQFGFAPQSQVWGTVTGRRAPKVFYVIYRAILNGVSDQDWMPVYRSEAIDVCTVRNQAVTFEGASINAEHLYGNDENRGLRFEIFHFNASGPHIPLGFVQTSASAFKYAKPGGKLYMVPVPGSRMKSGHVNLEMAKIGLTTRRGGVSSVFCLRADGFSWGYPGEGLVGDDYLERDAYGRTRIEYLSPDEVPSLPRGVSYMTGRARESSSNDGDDYNQAEKSAQ